VFFVPASPYKLSHFDARDIQPKKTLRFQYRLRACYPIRAKAPAAHVYEYYNPGNEARTRPVEIVVQ